MGTRTSCAGQGTAAVCPVELHPSLPRFPARAFGELRASPAGAGRSCARLRPVVVDRAVAGRGRARGRRSSARGVRDDELCAVAGHVLGLPMEMLLGWVSEINPEGDKPIKVPVFNGGDGKWIGSSDVITQVIEDKYPTPSPVNPHEYASVWCSASLSKEYVHWTLSKNPSAKEKHRNVNQKDSVLFGLARYSGVCYSDWQIHYIQVSEINPEGDKPIKVPVFNGGDGKWIGSSDVITQVIEDKYPTPSPVNPHEYASVFVLCMD